MIGKNFPLHIYYHIGCIDIDYRDIVHDQINHIMSSGLYDNADKIFYSIVGENNLILPEKFECVYKNADIRVAELPIMEVISKHSKSDEFKCFYFHTKGSGRNYSKLPKKVGDEWRRYMEYFNIDFWEQNYNLLDKYDTVGTSFLKGKDWYQNHYSGNFWWSKSEYLKELRPVHNIQIPKHANIRYKAEMWVLSNPNAIYYNWFDYNPNSNFVGFISPNEYKK